MARLRLDSTLPRWVPWILVPLAVIVVVLSMRIDLVLASTTPTNGDLGGHVWGPWQLRTQLLPSLSAWSPEWYGGFPLYLAYPVLPALAIAMLSFLVPYGIAIKVVIVIGCASIPAAAWAMGRLGKLPEPAPSLMAVFSLVAILDNTSLYGATIQSAIIGEYSEGLAVPLSLLALGLLDRTLREGRTRWLTTLVIAAAALCHPLGALVLAVGALLLIVLHFGLHGLGTLRRGLPVLAVSAALGAFWFIPFLAYSGELGHGAPFTVAPLLGTYLASLPIWAELLLIPLALLGAVACVARRSTLGMALAGLTVLALVGSFTLAHWSVGSIEDQRTAAWLAGRLIPLFELGLVLVAAIGVSTLVALVAPLWRSGGITIVALTVLVTIGALGINGGWLPGSSISPSFGTSGAVADNDWLGIVHVQTNSLPTVARISFGGYQKMATWPQYREIVGEVGRVTQRHGCGRFLTEADVRGSYGSVFEFALLPYWTDGCATTIGGGNPIEDSWTGTLADQAQAALSGRSGHIESVPYPAADEHAGVTALGSLGVRYLMVFTPSIVMAAQADHRLSEVGQAGVWHIFEVRGTSLVTTLRRNPRVVPGSVSESFSKWNATAAKWMLSEGTPRPAAGGPADWPRSTTSPDLATKLPRARVSNVTTTRTSISFDVSRTGVPVVVAASYFPWWRADGAEGPWRIAPNELVVVPTAHHVTLTVGPRTIDAVARTITALGIAGLVGLAVFDRRRRQASEENAQEGSSR